MNLKYITCSDPRNYNTIYELFDLWDIDPRVEIAVQMHPGKVSPDTERYKWIRGLIDGLYIHKQEYNLAIHVNNDWCDDICNGVIPAALEPLFNASSYYKSRPLVQRIQLNMPKHTAENFNAQKLKPVIDSYNDKEFIIQYKPTTVAAVDALHKSGTRFSLLFDESGGKGRDASAWRAPIFPGQHLQGYSGGMSPENVADNLTKISRVADGHDIWIDAEGKLKRDDKFDIGRAKQYIQNALRWDEKQR